MKAISRVGLVLFVVLLASSTVIVITHAETPPTYELRVTIDGDGSVGVDDPGPDYHQYDMVKLTANPAEGWTFDHWWIYNGTIWETTRNPLDLIINSGSSRLVLANATFKEIPTYEPTIESCDSTGITKDTFAITDDVYLIGYGFSPSTTYDLYIVRDVATWTDGTPIPMRVFGTATNVTSNAFGNVTVSLVWEKLLVLGKYDILVDVNGNGVYDEGVDVLDDNDVEVTAGLNVIPEVPLGTVLAGIAMVIAFGAYKKRKTRTPNKQLNKL